MSTKLSDIKADTICALATAQGHSALAVIRVSGNKSNNIFNEITQTKKKEFSSHKVFLKKIYDFDNQVIDQVLITCFEEGKSYTGEESFEISCHGNPLIIKKILTRLNQAGARSAEKGEFTFRAFLNNKIDLVQAESVLSLIEGQSEKSIQVSLRQLEGKTSKEFIQFESELTWCLAHIEASIDFSTEGLEVVSQEVLIEKLSLLKDKLETILNTYLKGQIIKDGLKISLIGLPNAGKSSLLNLLTLDEKAIVTPIAGTTRDIIQAETYFQGIKIHFSDTAGIRETQDLVESLGVEKSKSEAKKSDLISLVIDISTDDYIEKLNSLIESLNLTSESKFVLILNKKDLVQNLNEKIDNIKNFFSAKLSFRSFDFSLQSLFTNANEPAQREDILRLFLNQFESLYFLNESIISSARQNEMLEFSKRNIEEAINELSIGMGSEFVAQSLKQALIAIQKILGHAYDDQILDRVFKEFCLGK